ncbi:hypothetical protein F5Y03DRAFT_113464 [Xylaria venustula]|nr:hypothetical protein F5Y03DRAFT_113464 [Xylaria venustula]
MMPCLLATMTVTVTLIRLNVWNSDTDPFSAFADLRPSATILLDPSTKQNGMTKSTHLFPKLLSMPISVLRSRSFSTITDARISLPFRDPSTILKDSKLDYAIFLAPPPTNPLGLQIAFFMSNTSSPFVQLNALESFEVDRPLALATETKRTRGGDANAPSQLANYARAHYRMFRYLFEASNQQHDNNSNNDTGGGGDKGGIDDDDDDGDGDSAEASATGPLLILPLIEV